MNPVYGGSGEDAVASFVQGWLEERGIQFSTHELVPGRRNVVARIGPLDAPALLLEAHMDTVGVAGWANGSPFELQERSGRLYGRGACDTKASLSCFMLTLDYFHRNPGELSGALVFAASVDEESEQIGAYQLAELKRDLNIDRAITGEPTRSDVVSRHKGVGRYRIELGGKAAHGSTPHLGENAILKAAKVCAELGDLADRLRAGPGEMEIDLGSLNIGAIEGGIGFNVVPDRCVIDLDRRYGIRETPADGRSQFEAICSRWQGARLESLIERPALTGENSKAFVQSMLRAGRASGVAIEEREVAYMTNAVAYEEAGMQSLVFGPGDIAQAHKNDEFIEVGEMERCLKILRTLLRAEC
ncbi:M20/M25/M40 family metallo-hydrolase [Pelagicoccus sp. SDUM812003]|uniref:M20 family metallopeptidase n=1 Tax=Pelagicoccus sp. SDUM812003 TaxID=3041267 RepID=UPI00280DAD34|nr:M20/M25/M40 family metallo-hydrolase [Pelagicoccus sp. SDUM812003]MDQ8204595.1 M20/M25/M40 family metallo-hydrolase [Pelagicoccus sp. SDUM812003]